MKIGENYVKIVKIVFLRNLKIGTGNFRKKSVLKRVNFGVFYVIGLDGKCLIRY